MNHATHGKFCHRPITVTVDDAYSELGDPYKILPLAACNPCGDLRVNRRRLEDKIRKLCVSLATNRSESNVASARKLIQRFSQDYARMICQWHGMEGMVWDEECVRLLMEKPDKWGMVLGMLWKMFKDSGRVSPSSIGGD